MSLLVQCNSVNKQGNLIGCRKLGQLDRDNKRGFFCHDVCLMLTERDVQTEHYQSWLLIIIKADWFLCAFVPLIKLMHIHPVCKCGHLFVRKLTCVHFMNESEDHYLNKYRVCIPHSAIQMLTVTGELSKACIKTNQMYRIVHVFTGNCAVTKIPFKV